MGELWSITLCSIKTFQSKVAPAIGLFDLIKSASRINSNANSYHLLLTNILQSLFAESFLCDKDMDNNCLLLCLKMLRGENGVKVFCHGNGRK